jgi:NitT/TauT family transport system ATP-binding protein
MIRLKQVGVEYRTARNTVEAIRQIDLEIPVEFLALVGPSGCGKSTLLRVLAGLIRPTKGSVEFDGADNIKYGIVFQDYSLLPWLTTQQNIELGLKVNGVPFERRAEISRRLLHRLGLEDASELLPHQLSGGMRQRAAVGRAFAPSPPLLLMDEPFGALDAITREDLQENLTRLYESERHTIVFVTHDVEEALYMSDRICLMTARPGQISRLIDVPFPRPRQESMKRRSDFIELAQEVKDLLSAQYPPK